MGRRKTRTFTEVELEFMQIIWSGGELTTDQVLKALSERGRVLADGSVRKVLSILITKGHLTRRRVGRGHAYQAKMPEDEAHRSLVLDLLRRAFGGSAALLVAALLDSRAVSTRDIKEIKRLIARRERDNRK